MKTATTITSAINPAPYISQQKEYALPFKLPPYVCVCVLNTALCVIRQLGPIQHMMFSSMVTLIVVRNTFLQSFTCCHSWFASCSAFHLLDLGGFHCNHDKNKERDYPLDYAFFQQTTKKTSS